MAETDDFPSRDALPVKVRRRRRSGGRPVEDPGAGRWTRWGALALGAGVLCPVAHAYPPLALGLVIVGLFLIGRGLQTRNSIWHRQRLRAPDMLFGGLLLVGSAALALFLADPDWIPSRPASPKVTPPPGEFRWWP